MSSLLLPKTKIRSGNKLWKRIRAEEGEIRCSRKMFLLCKPFNKTMRTKLRTKSVHTKDGLSRWVHFIGPKINGRWFVSMHKAGAVDQWTPRGPILGSISKYLQSN